MLVQCWAIVFDAVPTLNQHRINVWCLLVPSRLSVQLLQLGEVSKGSKRCFTIYTVNVSVFHGDLFMTPAPTELHKVTFCYKQKQIGSRPAGGWFSRAGGGRGAVLNSTHITRIMWEQWDRVSRPSMYVYISISNLRREYLERGWIQHSTPIERRSPL